LRHHIIAFANSQINMGFLFEQIIFGPVKSRRLGISLGVNTLPLNVKHCTFNCLYCECGWTKPKSQACLTYPSRDDIREALDIKLITMRSKHAMLDTITFAGNGEPTLHKDFSGIIDDTIELRNKYYPDAGIAVLSNASLIGKDDIANALLKVDRNILKLDAGTEETFQKINNPRIPITLKEIIQNLQAFRNQMIIQTLFTRGTYHGEAFDNTTEEEISAWLEHIKFLQPRLVMIYPIARATPAEDVEKLDFDELQAIAQKVEALGIAAEVY
jgi:wyosine [tRNA(Phe)-imidazoG37] synthetase (radical SAM superfamily)